MISTVDLLVLTGLDLLLLFMQTLFSFDLHKATKWGGKLYCTGPSPSVSVPWYRYSKLRYIYTDRIYGSKNSATLAFKGFQALSLWATYNPVSYHLAQGTKALHLLGVIGWIAFCQQCRKLWQCKLTFNLDKRIATSLPDSGALS